MTDNTTIKKHIVLPASLAQLIEEKASKLGLAFSNLVEDALLESVGLSRDPRTELMMRVADRLQQLTTFPPDVIRGVFEEIKNTPLLHDLYKLALQMSPVSDEKLARVHLNRRITMCITQVLRVRPTGRVTGSMSPDSLIHSYHLVTKDQSSDSSSSGSA